MNFTHVLVIGCGDIGRRVGRLWRIRGLRVEGLVRRDEMAEVLAADEITAVRGDLDDPESLSGLPTANALIYYFAPPPAAGTTDPRMRAFLGGIDPGGLPARVVYISTSGIYGDRQGAWVDEDAEPRPASERARRRLDAESVLRTWGGTKGIPVVVLRVGGIYAAGRLPLERLRKGLPVLREEESPYTNRIHADDLARVCVAAAEKGRPDSIYNVSDGTPGTMTEYFFAVADRVGLPRPPAITLAEARERMTPAMIAYLTESRRLDSRRMREELGIEPHYPDLASGLDQAIGKRNG